MIKLIIRAGDGDDYHAFDGPLAAANHLALEGAVPPLRRSCVFGLDDSIGFGGQNYISCYWGPWPIPTAQVENNREITDTELVDINAHMARVLAAIQRRVDGIVDRLDAMGALQQQVKAYSMVYQGSFKQEAAAEIGLEDWRVMDMEFAMWDTIRDHQWNHGTVIGACTPFDARLINGNATGSNYR